MTTELVQSLTDDEISFAQRLASGEVGVRRKALVKLRKWFHSTISQKDDLASDDFMRLWKGLYYCMWLQDKPVHQEELADHIVGLLSTCGRVDKCIMFQETFYRTLAGEWSAIDKWRLDKYMMFVRRMLRATLAYIRTSHSWSPAIIDQFVDSWRQTVLCTDASVSPAGLNYHFASIFLDELDHASIFLDVETANFFIGLLRVFGNTPMLNPNPFPHLPPGTVDHPMTIQCVSVFLQPFIELLSDQYFDTICTEIFETVLISFSAEEKQGRQPLEQDESDESSGTERDSTSATNAEPKQGILFDYASVGKQLFAVGKRASVTSQRRKKLYLLVKRFESASLGRDPFEERDENDVDDFNLDVGQEGLNRAAIRLLRREEAVRLDKQRALAGKRKRKQQLAAGDGGDDSSDDIIEMQDDDIEDASFEEDNANFDLEKNKQAKSPKRTPRTKRLTKRAPKKQQQNKKSSKSVPAKKKPKKSG